MGTAQPFLSRSGRRRKQAPGTISHCAVFRGEAQRPLKSLAWSGPLLSMGKEASGYLAILLAYPKEPTADQIESQ